MLADISEEFEEAVFGDSRLTTRLGILVDTLVEAPDWSFPEAAATDSELEGTYRFLSNEKVVPRAILEPHVRATVRRAAALGTIVVAHDTTEFNFGKTLRRGLGRVGLGKSFGFYGHFALAVAADESRTPLGLLGLTTVICDGEPTRASGRKLPQDSNTNESARWPALVDVVEEQLGSAASAVHVMDRQADSFHLLTVLQRRSARFVIRVCHVDRLLGVGESARTVQEALNGTAVIATREVPLNPRGISSLPTYRRLYPARGARSARLEVRASVITIPRPSGASAVDHPGTLSIHAIQVMEVDAPEGVAPVNWTLWTSEPIATPEDVLLAVDYYRRRWVIEEYFKALKSGCAYEKRQLESKHALLNALAVFAPIAWNLLRLRSTSRTVPDGDPSLVVTPAQLHCLRLAAETISKRPLPPSPTIADVTSAIARLGGHLVNNGEPGWIVLGRGLEKLLGIELGFRFGLAAAQHTAISDQS